MLANLVNKPINRPNPININPQILKKSVIDSAVGLAMIQWKNPEKSHLDSIK